MHSVFVILFFFNVPALSQIYTDFLISKDILIITDYYHQSFNISIFQYFNLLTLP